MAAELHPCVRTERAPRGGTHERAIDDAARQDSADKRGSGEKNARPPMRHGNTPYANNDLLPELVALGPGTALGAAPLRLRRTRARRHRWRRTASPQGR